MTDSNYKHNPRIKVIKTLLNIQKGISLSAMLDGVLKDMTEQDRGFTHHLLLTTLRHWVATARLLDSLADKPIDEVEVRTTLQVGITQLLYLDTADHASIFETVEAIKAIGFERASGLVNAILRKVAKHPNRYRKQCDKKHSLPNWLAKQLKQDWQSDYKALCDNVRTSAPLFLRVNERQSTVDDYLQQLQQADISAEIIPLTIELANIGTTTASPIRLEQTQAVNSLPHFATGMVSVQDAHATIAGTIVKQLADNLQQNKQQEKPTDKVQILDACTAPSGKLAHCLESINTDNKQIINIIGIDNDESRLQRSRDNLTRLGLLDETDLICTDATEWHYQEEQNKRECFDIILLDAPCSATGVIRRHPDISLLRQEGDIAQTVQLQRQILDNLWSQLKVGGYLVYVTCSILKAENEMQMVNFAHDYDNVEEISINGDWGIAQKIGRQCLPLAENTGDGFYYAVLKKR